MVSVKSKASSSSARSSLKQLRIIRKLLLQNMSKATHPRDKEDLKRILAEVNRLIASLESTDSLSGKELLEIEEETGLIILQASILLIRLKLQDEI